MIPIVIYISSAPRPAPLRTRDTNRLNPGNNRGVRNVSMSATTTGDVSSKWKCRTVTIDVTANRRQLVADARRPEAILTSRYYVDVCSSSTRPDVKPRLYHIS